MASNPWNVHLGADHQPNKRRTSSEANGRVDNKLDDLPCEILITILNFLNTKDATRTSVLSRKWRNLFTYQTNLSFFGSLKLKNVTDKFLNSIDQVLQLNRSSHIEGFKICSALINSQANYINRWVKFALQKGVTTLELDFYWCPKLVDPSYHHCTTPYPYILHRSILMNSSYESRFNLLTSICLKGVAIGGNLFESILSKCEVLERLIVARSIVKLSELLVVSKSLKFLVIESCKSTGIDGRSKVTKIDAVNLISLCLKDVAIRGNLIESVLSKCNVLERLIVAWSTIDLVELKVASKSLKFLVIEGCRYDLMNDYWKVIEIDAVNLISLTYFGTARIKYVSVPSLVEASLDLLSGLHSKRFKPIISSIYNQLSKLRLNLYVCKDIRLPIAPTFNNVRCLELKVGVNDHNFYIFSYVTSFLKLFPSLRKLQLEINWNCICRSKYYFNSDYENEMKEFDSDSEVDMLFNLDDKMEETYSLEDVRQFLEAKDEKDDILAHLQCLEWRGAFRRHFRHEVLLALSIVKSAKMLEKFVCDPHCPFGPFGPKDDDMKENARENAKDLALVMPKHVNFVIL